MKFSTLMRAAGRAAACLAVVSTLAACGGDGSPIIPTTSGEVIGIERSTLNAYLGIPYAAPPTGTLRWRAPTAPASWSGVRATRSFASHCPQNASPFGVATDTSEDCLYLNVYTPKSAGPHPVMVWIHGGAFVYGQGDAYNPQRLVDQGTVVVTINYRLGALGFMSHSLLTAEQSGSSGNYGLMDQQAALRWVRDNIGGFGGNRDNVTIFGESAGAFSVHSHIASAGSAGLFHKAIIMSGAYALDGQSARVVPGAAGAYVTDAEEQGVALAAAAGGSACTDVACLRALPVSALLTAQAAVWPSGAIPSIDGSVLTQSVKATITAGTHNRVPIIQGTTQDEWSLFVAFDEYLPRTSTAPWRGGALSTDPANEKYLGAAIAGTFPFLALNPVTGAPDATIIPGLIAHPTLSPYRPSAFAGSSASLAMTALGTDLLFACNARVSSKLQEPHANVYAYEFADTTAPTVFPDSTPISFTQNAEHTSELAYVFDISGKTLTAAQQATAAAMVGHWARFASTGNPNPTATPNAWPVWGATDSVLRYDAAGATTTLTDAQFAANHKCALWTPTLVDTAQGQVMGSTAGAVKSFLSIPYAAPPTGALRWTAPADPATRTSTRQATSFGNHCAQSASLGSGSTSEDCLFLNVFAPTAPGPHPVIVWFHGGAFVGGTAASYVPTALVGQNTVVVSVNYRLGALGFLAHPALSAENTAGTGGAGASGNYGLMDQQKALAWVRDNIANFGGDASSVTLMGESAGGASVMAHLASAGSAGLFHKAIVMSGAYSSQTSLASAYTGWQAVPTAGSCSTSDAGAATASCLRSMSVAQLLAAQATAYPSGPQPIADGRVLTASTGATIAAGTHNRVPVMQGSTRDEWRYFVASTELRSGVPLNDSTYPAAVTSLNAALTGLHALYPSSVYGGSASLAFGALGTDVIFACPARNSSLELQQHATVYAFQFRDRTAPAPLPTVGAGGALSFSQGAAHSAELTYLFTMATRGALNADQQALSDTMTRYWARFARAGDPNGGTDPTWPTFTAASPVYQGLDIGSGGVAPLPTTLFARTVPSVADVHNCTAYTPTN